MHFTEHLTSTTKHSRSPRTTASRQAAELTAGLGDLQRLPGLFQAASGDLPPHQNQEGKKLITRKPRREAARRHAYNDAVDAGSPRAREYGRDVSGMALLAVVDALEHAIFTAVRRMPRGGKRERHKNQPTSCEASTKKRAK